MPGLDFRRGSVACILVIVAVLVVCVLTLCGGGSGGGGAETCIDCVGAAGADVVQLAVGELAVEQQETAAQLLPLLLFLLLLLLLDVDVDTYILSVSFPLAKSFLFRIAHR